MDLGFDMLRHRTLMVFGKFFTGMMLHTELARSFKYLITFLGDRKIYYRVLYIGTNASSEGSDLVQELINSCGKTTVDYLEDFVFVSVPYYTSFKFACCMGPVARGITATRYTYIRELVQHYY